MLPHSFAAVFMVPFAAAASGGVTVLFQNDGNWTSHAEKPSALLVHRQSSFEDAVATCNSQDEALLGCGQIQHFHEQLNYQKFIGNIQDDELFWTDCSESSLVSWSGGSTSAASNDSGLHYFLCTNSAPIVDKVDTDFSVYPRVNVSANGTTFEGLRDHMAFRFLGVPFAQPPVGNLRLKYAQPWTGSFVDATEYRAACIQTGWYDGNAYGLNPWGNSEDCLYLNVFTPGLPDPAAAANEAQTLKPVMFWMHGGAMKTGTGSDATFDGASLASRSDVVVVAINYRLSIFGYLGLDDAIPGNYATSDKIAALQWVRDHISAFGGDPSSVTIFGQSAGGGSVIDLIASPRAEGLFHAAIIQSGGKGWAQARADAAAAIEPYIRPLCNQTGTARLECLQALPADTLFNLTSQGGSWQTVIDDDYTLDIPIAQVSKGRQSINSVKVMLGFMPEEGQSLLELELGPNLTTFSDGLGVLVENGRATQEQADAVLDSGLWVVGNGSSSTGGGSTTYPDAYNASISIVSDLVLTCGGSQFASVGAASAAFEAMWVYSLERAYALSYYNWYDACTFPVGEPDTPYYRCHSGDLYEVFGTYYLFDRPVRVAEDIYFTNAVQDMWASFARAGNPNVDVAYLEARGYNSTIELFSSWEWPEFNTWSPRVASIQYPQSSVTTLPEQQHCKVLLPLIS
ncbi:carboxylesterase [Diplodia corticola]|uniref:Carboxylic ester hydrolase n=1 Tax=Diplodia corticola TaxID=236234 RepID=A0A1J9QLU3_9PEZI|nr:carboxylesterase [Diplodia corticola]OJD29432.1 carboxylesterase [Diplodia corticola]